MEKGNQMSKLIGEPINDTINRQDAINGIIKSCFGQANVVQAEAAIIQYIKRIPSVQPKQQWILCSEKLPKKYSDVLCCDTYGEYIIGIPFEDEESNTGFSVENDGIYMIDCIAWMPLPEPYKKGDQDE